MRRFIWTTRPGWYLARGWRVRAVRQGQDYTSMLLERP